MITAFLQRSRTVLGLNTFIQQSPGVVRDNTYRRAQVKE